MSNKRKTLIVGDPHATVEDLSDCNGLIALIKDTVKHHKVQDVVFLGDMHHNHAVVRIEIIDFWRNAFSSIKEEGTNVLALVGNHDRSHDANLPVHALSAYRDLIQVIESPFKYAEGIWMVPFYHDTEKLIGDVEKMGNLTTLVCHQSFNGARFENGMYDPHGINPLRINAKVLSGHIHTPQAFANIVFPGAPRWRIASDANTERHLWVADAVDGEFRDVVKVPTNTHCREIIRLDINEGDEELQLLNKNAEILVSIRGSRSFCNEKSELWASRGARVSVFEKKTGLSVVRESDGIQKALSKFISAYRPANGTSSERLAQMVTERIHV